MKIALIALLLLYIGCQDYNSNTFDQDRYGEIEFTNSAGIADFDKFKSSYKILQNKCMTCHRHAQWSAYTDTKDWVTNENLITPGAGDSQVITRIINAGTTQSDMPQGGSALPASDFQTLKDWEAEY